jgi:hypothetical protein
VFLAVDEAVALGRMLGMTAPDVAARAPAAGHDLCFHAFLNGPALLIGGQPQIPVRGYNDRIGHLSTL